MEEEGVVVWAHRVQGSAKTHGNVMTTGLCQAPMLSSLVNDNQYNIQSHGVHFEMTVSRQLNNIQQKTSLSSAQKQSFLDSIWDHGEQHNIILLLSRLKFEFITNITRTH